MQPGSWDVPASCPGPAWLRGPSALPLHIPQSPAQEIPRGREGASTSPKPAGDPPAPLGQPEAARRPPGLGAFLCPDPPAPGTPTPGLGQPQGPKSPSPDICTPSTAPHVLAPSTRAQRPAWDPHPTLPPVPLSLGGARCWRQGCPGGSLPALLASGRSPAPRVSLPECLPSSSTRANTATTRLLTTAEPRARRCAPLTWHWPQGAKALLGCTPVTPWGGHAAGDTSPAPGALNVPTFPREQGSGCWGGWRHGAAPDQPGSEGAGERSPSETRCLKGHRVVISSPVLSKASA